MSRPLHAVFTELLNDDAVRQAYAADPSGPLEDAGHAGLPDELVAEAIVSFADTASPAVAEHLAPFVKAHGPVPGADEIDDPAALDGLALLADAPAGGRDAPDDEEAGLLDPAATVEPAALHEPASAVDDLDFGTGSDLTTPSPAPDPEPVAEFGAAPLDDAVATPAPGHDDEPLIAEPVGEGDEPDEDVDTD